MTPQEIQQQIVVCKRRAANAEGILRAFSYTPGGGTPDQDKIRFWQAEVDKYLQYVKELEEELADYQQAA